MTNLETKPLTLRRNFSWTFMGNAVYAACQWGMLVILAKLGSPEIVGQFTLGLAITAPVILFTNLHLRVVQSTDAQYQYLFSDYLGLRSIGTVVAILTIAIIAFATGYRGEMLLVIITIGIAKGFEAISDVFYGLLQQHERMDRIAISMIIKGFLSLLMLGLGVYLSGGILWGVVGLAVSWFAVLIVYDFRSGVLLLKSSISTLNLEKPRSDRFANRLKPRWHLPTLRKLILLTLPLGFVMMLISLNSSIPRYFIERYLGQRELGVFAALAYLIVAGNMVIGALGESAIPKLSKYYASGDAGSFQSLLFKLAGIGLLLGIGGVLVSLFAGKEILTLLYRAEYAQYSSLFVWLMISGGITYVASFFGYGMVAVRYFRIQIPLFLFVVTTLSVCCLWLIPQIGLLGAAIALIVAAIVQLVFSAGTLVYALKKLNRSN
jgi:O-antigen/teichoic acid export membrane protein